MTIGFCTQHLHLGKFIIELAVIFKYEAKNHTLGENCEIQGAESSTGGFRQFEMSPIQSNITQSFSYRIN